jgi:hypothetical protein
MRAPPALLLLCLAQALAVPTRADSPAVVVRSGDHPGFGRLVFDLPTGTAATFETADGAASLHFLPPLHLQPIPHLPRNVIGMQGVGEVTRILLKPGVTLRRMQMGTHLVLDFLDVAKVTMSATPSKPPQSPPDTAPPPAAPPANTPVPPPSSRSDDEARSFRIAAAPAPPPSTPDASPARSALLPFDADVGAAAFRRNSRAYVVFDQRRPIDLSALRQLPVFTEAAVRLLPAGTELSFPIGADAAVALTREAAGWVVALRPASLPGPEALRIDDRAQDVHFAAAAPGRVVALPDPDSAAPMLVGTLRAPEAGIATARRAPQYGIVPTWLGVLVEAVSDQLILRPVADGFTLAGAPDQPLAVPTFSRDLAAVETAAHFSRRYDLPALPTDALLRRLQAAQAAAATAAPQGRLELREQVAQAMLALGLDAEAQALLSLTAADEVRAGDDPDLIGLQAIAALLADRPTEAAGIDDPRLDGSDEIVFWRALRQAGPPAGPAAAAPALAATLPLVLTYPETLRRRLLPRVAEVLVAGGQAKAAQALVDAMPDDRTLDLARASLLQDGDPDTALALLDRIAAGPDRLARYRALRQAVELRLARREIAPTEAADRLDRALFAWRGDAREYGQRLRIADLRCQAGQWRPAIALLRETGQIWPDRAEELHHLLSDAFAQAIGATGERQLKPFDLVALAEENTDLLPDGEVGHQLAGQIADRLEALDLPKLAATTLDKLVRGAPQGLGRAQFGEQLAAMRMDTGDAAGALDALNQSTAPDLPPALQESRTLLFARAAARAGDRGSALAALDGLDSEAALATRADLLESAQDWEAATIALAALAARRVPAQGPLEAGQSRLMLRLASAADRAGDVARIAQLRAAVTGRLPDAKTAQMFDLLTAAPLTGIGDLARAGQDARFARVIPSAVKSLTQ